MSQTRNRRLRRLKNSKKGSKFSFKKILFFVTLIIGLFLLFTRSSLFRDFDKLTFVSPTSEGDVLVTTFDKKGGKVTHVKIPGNTEVSVARQLGTWKIKSVWQLGINEGVGGRLLAETVSKNFYFPVFAWTDSQGSGLTQGDLIAKVKAIFYIKDSNLGFGDRAQMALTSFGLKSFDRMEVDLGESSFLKRMTLKDGSVGYIILGKIPQYLIVVFADESMTEREVRIIIKNASGAKNLSGQVAGILQILGGKVAASIDENEEDFDCEVSAKERIIAQKISALFSCQIINRSPAGSFDLEVRVGKQFAKRF